MLTVDMSDKHLTENLKAIMECHKSGLFTDEELQKMYDAQVVKDKRSEGADDE